MKSFRSSYNYRQKSTSFYWKSKETSVLIYKTTHLIPPVAVLNVLLLGFSCQYNRNLLWFLKDCCLDDIWPRFASVKIFMQLQLQQFRQIMYLRIFSTYNKVIWTRIKMLVECTKLYINFISFISRLKENILMEQNFHETYT